MKAVLLICFLSAFGLCVSVRADEKKSGFAIEYRDDAKLQFTFVKKELTERDGWSVTVRLKNSESTDIHGISYRVDFFEGSRRMSWTSSYHSVQPDFVKRGAEVEFTLVKGVASSIDRIVIYGVRLE